MKDKLPGDRIEMLTDGGMDIKLALLWEIVHLLHEMYKMMKQNSKSKKGHDTGYCPPHPRNYSGNW